MENNNVKFTGVMSALVSCIDENENVKEDSMRRLMNWHLKEGFSGFYLTGGTGEGPVLQKSTRMKIAEIAKDEAGSRCKLIAHVGAIDLKTATELAKHAGQIGLDAISSVPPFFFGYGEAQIADYYKALADASGLPVLMYASPLAGVNITWDMVDRFMDIPGMIGLKWTSHDYFTMHRIKSLRGGNINVINGPDELLLCGLTMGADGGIGTTYNVMPGWFCELYDAFRAGDYETARKTQFRINRVIEILRRYTTIPAVKESFRFRGIDAGNAAYPGRVFTPEESAALQRELREAGIDV